MAELSRDDVLPCDVLVAPGTIIRAGCDVSTLLLCLGNRVGREIAKFGPRGEVRAPQSVSVPAGFELIAAKGLSALCEALERAHRNGYMPDAMTAEWEAFDWRLAAPAAATREGKE